MAETRVTPETNAPEKVPVFNSTGQVGTIPKDQLADALETGGYRQASPEDLKQAELEQEQGDRPFTAGAEAFGSALTFGASRHVENWLGLTNPENQAARAKMHPFSRAVGTGAGIVAGLAIPGAGEAEAATEAAGSADALSSILKANPVAMTSKAGKAVQELSSPTAEAFAKAVANPETSPLINRMIREGIAGGLGSAAEGAAYGLGQSVEESALGDPQAMSEHLMANIGHGALLAGAMGTAISSAMSPFVRSETEQALDEAHAHAAQNVPGIAEANEAAVSGSIDDSVAHSDQLSKAEKQSFFEGLKERKPEAENLENIADQYGLHVTPGQVTENAAVRDIDSMIGQSDSIAAARERALRSASNEKVNDLVRQTLGPEKPELERMSEAELGESVRNDLSSQLKDAGQEFDQAYNQQIQPILGPIELSPRAVNQIARNIETMPGIVNAAGESLGTPAAQWAQKAAEMLRKAKTLEDLGHIKTALRSSAPKFWEDAKVAHFASEVDEKLANFKLRAIDRFAEAVEQSGRPDGAAIGSKLRELKAQMVDTNAKYATFAQKFSKLMKGVGGKFSGAESTQAFMEELDASKIGAKIARQSPEFLEFLKEHAPDSFQKVQEYAKSKIQAQSFRNLEHGREFSAKAAIDAYKKMAPEMRELVFSEGERKTLSDMKDWIDSFGAKWGPSGTPAGLSNLALLLNPKFALAKTAADWLALRGTRYLSGLGKADADFAAKTAGLGVLERMVNRSGVAIKKGVRQVFSPEAGMAAAAAISTFGSTPKDKKESYQRAVASLNQDSANVDAGLDKLSKSTEALSSIAPITAMHLQTGAARASSFLQSKIPQVPQASAFDPTPKLPSVGEISRFDRYYTAVNKPHSVLNEIPSGRVSQEGIETLQTVYPTLYSQMKTALLDKLNEKVSKGERIPFKTRQGISAFIGAPLDGSINNLIIPPSSPQAPAAPGESLRPSQKGIGKLSKDSAVMTPMQAVEQRRMTEEET